MQMHETNRSSHNVLLKLSMLILEIHENFASKISAAERNLESLRREKEAKVQNSKAKKINENYDDEGKKN